jgi:hypothetical protein
MLSWSCIFLNLCVWVLGASDSSKRANSGERVDISKTWHFLGPFLAGKPELEGDPTKFYGGIAALYANKANSTLLIPSEIVHGGHVDWQTFTASGEQLGGIQSPSVRIQPRLDWQTLVNAAGMEVLEFQGWAVTSIRVSKPTYLRVRCAGVVLFCIHSKMSNGDLWPLAGDIYHNGRAVGFIDVTPCVVDGCAYSHWSVGRSAGRLARHVTGQRLVRSGYQPPKGEAAKRAMLEWRRNS